MEQRQQQNDDFDQLNQGSPESEQSALFGNFQNLFTRNELLGPVRSSDCSVLGLSARNGLFSLFGCQTVRTVRQFLKILLFAVRSTLT